MNDTFIERRRYPRADVDYKVILETASGDEVVLRTRNISGSGIYFYTRMKLTEFTEVLLDVSLPPVGGAGELSFQCAGVIVRVEDKGNASEWPFAAAVQFSGIDESYRKAICAYVDAVLEERRKRSRE